MFYEKEEVRELLRRLVCQLASNAVLWEDLLQEALIHLWRQETNRPGQSQSWYVQNCRFYLLNFLRYERRIYSLTHAPSVCHLPEDSEESDDEDEFAPSIDPTLSCVCSDDIVELLSHRLPLLDRRILSFLADGFSVDDIALQLCLSHQAVSKHRKKIASLATHLGILPVSSCIDLGAPHTASVV
jgi:RNA polymerase sigma factor (sigma-70 family)